MDRKLFELPLSTPAETDRIAYGNSGQSRNITISDFRAIMSGGSAGLSTCILEIGDWNMYTSGGGSADCAKTVAHSFGCNIDKIRSIDVIIQTDPDVSPKQIMPLNMYWWGATENTQGGVYQVYDTHFYLQSKPSGFFNTTAFNCTPYNRGWITIQHAPFTPTTTTTTTTTTPAPSYNDINLNEFCYNGGDGSYYTYRCACIESTPPMSVGDCYCLCLYVPLYLNNGLFSSGSYSEVHVYCNASCIFGACICNTQCINASTSFVVCYGDTVYIDNSACVTSLGCGANSCTCIGVITPIVGSYQIGATCCSSCSYTG